MKWLRTFWEILQNQFMQFSSKNRKNFETSSLLEKKISSDQLTVSWEKERIKLVILFNFWPEIVK